MLPFINKHTHRYMQAHTQQLPPSANTLVQTSKNAHTFKCTLTYTLITCILLWFVFAEQSLFPFFTWLTSFRSLHRPSPPTSDATITQAYENTDFKTGACLLRIVKNEEEVEECTQVNSRK